MRIVCTGGGTGGHFYPIIAVIRELKRIAEDERILDLQLFYFGPEDFNLELLRDESVIFKQIFAGKIRRYVSLKNFSDTLITGLGVLQALWSMFIVMPDVVLCKGGYGSFPTVLAAWIYRIPVIVHESDAVPGRVNRWAGRFAKRIAISFPSAARFFPKERVALTGLPIRKRILGGSIDQARETFGVFSSRPVLFITGGSQGSEVINNTVIQMLQELIATYEVIHQVGRSNFDEMRLATASITEGGGESYYHLVSLLDEENMRSAFLLADLVISRAGATAIYEIAAWGKPAIVIPLKNSAQNHQRENAYEYGAKQAAVVIEEDNLTSSVLWNEIQKLMADPARRKAMGEAGKAFARLDASELIARELLTVGLHLKP